MGKKLKDKNYHRSIKRSLQKKAQMNECEDTKNDGNLCEPRRKTVEQKTGVKEDQVGITEFVTCSKGFIGVVKSRFSDFHVNEIDSSGKILHLNDLSIPQPETDGLTEEELIEAKEELREIIIPEVWDRIRTLAKLNVYDANARDTIDIEVSMLEKEQRTKIHRIIKRLYDGNLVTTTVNCKEGDDEEKKYIKIYKPKNERGEKRKRWNFPEEYVHFLVYKENTETSEIASIMALRLGLGGSQVNYCGTKDKRGKTTQKFCIKRRAPSQIVGSVKTLTHVKVGNFEFKEEVLKLGQLKGNRFRIALRHIQGEDRDIEAALQEIKEVGFINYYGLQRFGNSASVPTHEIGIALLKSDYKLACELILKPRENDVKFMRSIREEWWKSRNSAAAAAMCRGNKFIEKMLWDGLAQYGEKDYASALRRIPRNMLLLYPHAYQSLVFNRIASRRIKEFGLKLIPGDLVFRTKDEQDNETVEMIFVNEKKSKEKECETTTTQTVKVKESIFKAKVRALTADDISTGEWTIFDVLLPLPGFDITFPDNEVAKWYEEILEENGLSISKLKHNVKMYSMTGAYRKLIIKPENMKWEYKTYDTPESTLIASDWELLQKEEVVQSNGTEGKFKAIVLDFCLPACAYATMFLRELLKSDTSAECQLQLEMSAMSAHNLDNDIKEESIENEDGVIPEKRKGVDKYDGVDAANDCPTKKAKTEEV